MSKRSRTKFPNLKPELNLRTRYDLIDYDYIPKLSLSDKSWLNKFTAEYVNDSLNRISLLRNLHYNMKLKKDCDDRNNARNRCIFTREKAAGRLLNLDDLEASHDERLIMPSPEDDMIEQMDAEFRDERS